MPPQQSERPLDVFDDGLDFCAHGNESNVRADLAIVPHRRNLSPVAS
jgi:hypothetical protein